MAGVVGVLVLVAGGCRRADPPVPGPTVPEATTAPNTTAGDPYAVPAVIDKAYLDRVLKALYKIDGDASRIIVREKELVPEAARTLQAVYAGDELNDQLRLWNEAVAEGLEVLRNPPGDLNTTVEKLLTVKPECVFATVLQDFSPRSAQPAAPSPSYLALVRKLPTEDAGGLNPTPWAIGLDVVSVNDAPPEDPCGSL